MGCSFWEGVLEVFGLAERRDDFGDLAEIRTVHSSDGVRRLKIYRRTDGAYCFREEFYNTRRAEPCWEPAGADYAGAFPSPEAALEAAAGTLPWVNGEMRKPE